MTDPDASHVTPRALRAAAPLLVITCLLSPLLLLTRLMADGVVKDVVSLLLVLAMLATLIVPALLSRRATDGNGGAA